MSSSLVEPLTATASGGVLGDATDMRTVASGPSVCPSLAKYPNESMPLKSAAGT